MKTQMRKKRCLSGVLGFLTLLIISSILNAHIASVMPIQSQQGVPKPLCANAKDIGVLWNTMWGVSLGDSGRDVALDATGALYCVGKTWSLGRESDFALVKFYPNGTRAWNTAWGGLNSDEGLGMAVDRVTEALYCVGLTWSFGEGEDDFALVKFYPNGTKAWNTTWGGIYDDTGLGVVVDATGALYCVGWTCSFGAGGRDFALVKFYSNGTKAWNTMWGGIYDDYCSGVAVDAATGAIYCAGTTWSFGAGKYDFALVKFYPNGTRAWNTTWGGLNSDEGLGMAVDAATGALYCTGYTTSFGAGLKDFALVKFYPNGTRAWNTTWGGSNSDEGRGVAVDAATGALYCGGYTDSFGAGEKDLALVKFYPNGTRAWNITWGGSDSDEGWGMAVDATGALYCVGYTSSFGAIGDDFILVKFGLIPLPEPPVLDPILPNPDLDGIIELNWSDVSGAKIYYIYRENSSITSVEGFKPIDSVLGSNYTDNITINNVYFYVIVAGDGWGNSSISNCENVTVKIPQEFPIMLLILIIGGTVIGIAVIVLIILIRKRRRSEKRHWITKDGRRIFIKDTKKT